MCAVGGHWGRVNQLLLALGTEVFPGVWSHTEFNPYYFEVVGRQGSTNQLNPTAVFTGFLSWHMELLGKVFCRGMKASGGSANYLST